jgi:hypothetical protein
VFETSKDLLTSKTYNEYFKGGQFLIEDEFSVPAEVLNELGIKEQYIIGVGEHKVSERGGNLSIAL